MTAHPKNILTTVESVFSPTAQFFQNPCISENIIKGRSMAIFTADTLQPVQGNKSACGELKC